MAHLEHWGVWTSPRTHRLLESSRDTGFGSTGNTGGFGSANNNTGGGIFGGGSTGGFGSSGGTSTIL